MWEDFPLFPESASSYSDQVDLLYFYLVAVTVFFSVLISGLILYMSIRYRRSIHPVPVAIEGLLRLEILWIVIPLSLTMVMFGWGAKVFFDIHSRPDDAIDLYVTGKQWMWKIQHPQGQREINELHVPVGQKVRLTMTSEDVIHSFFVPAFRFKRDVLPGRYHRAWFEATQVGEYHLFCAEYCGTEHSRMVGTVYVLEPAEYQAWLQGAPAGEPPEEAGRKLFSAMRCDTCHAPGESARGPWLGGLFGAEVALSDGSTVTADEDYIRTSILRPMEDVVAGYNPVMPTYEGQLGEDQLMQLLAFIKTLDEGAER